MATRKIKDAKDLSTNELIYFKSHAQATYMSNGTTVEDAIDRHEWKIEENSNMVYISWSTLKEKRDAGDLVAGTFYWINDYVTTTSQNNTLTAGHLFDVIVFALSSNTLSEEAYAVHSGRDTDNYFANSNLAAWKIWYCLDNDTTRFAWAGATKKTINFDFLYAGQYGTFRKDESLVKEESDITYYGYKYMGGGTSGAQIFNENTILWYTEEFPEFSTERAPHIFYEFIDGVRKEREISSKFFESDIEVGKGVIYRMIDERGNDCPYDFKNILFTRYKLEAPEEYEADSMEDMWLEQLSKNIRAVFDAGIASYKWAGLELGEKNWEDDRGVICSHVTTERKSFYTFSDITNYEANESTVDASLSSNCHTNKMGVTKEGDVMKLPNNVFFGYFCQTNSLGDGCHSNSFGDYWYSNNFGDNCYYNSFSNNCYCNSLSGVCYYINFGDGCSFNSFENGCNSISFGNYCSSNNFGYGCYSSSFGNYCNYNNFGDDCFSNIFSDDCSSNRFGNACCTNRFVKGSNCNSLDDYCNANSFGDGYYYRYNTFSKGVEHVRLSNDEQGEYENCVQNYRISTGIRGTFEEPITLNVERNRIYETTIARNRNGEIVQFCVADFFSL